MSTQISPHLWLPEPQLSFHPDRSSDRDVHPLRGLLTYGPHSKSLVPDPVRVATLSPSGESDRLYGFMKELNSSYKPRERKDYLPDWPGFHGVFGIPMRGAGGGCHVDLDEDLEAGFTASTTPHVVLADRITRAVQALEAYRDQFDVLFIYLPSRWAAGFYGGPGEDFDLHDHIKAATAARRLPVQIVREDKALAYPCRASVMWRIGLALYAKAGGVPWKLADTDEEIAYIGISYAVRPMESGRPRFVTCCSQVFDAEGSGLEFVAYDAHEAEVQRDSPYLSRTEMFCVMTRSIELYRRRHAGRTPRRVMVHKTTEFKRDEVARGVGGRGLRLAAHHDAPRGRAHARPRAPRGSRRGGRPRRRRSGRVRTTPGGAVQATQTASQGRDCDRCDLEFLERAVVGPQTRASGVTRDGHRRLRFAERGGASVDPPREIPSAIADLPVGIPPISRGVVCGSADAKPADLPMLSLRICRARTILP